MEDKVGKRTILRKKGRREGGGKEGKGNLRREREDGYDALVGESNCKENGSLSAY